MEGIRHLLPALVLFFCVAPVTVADINQGLVLHLPFDGSAIDLSQTGDGNPVGGPGYEAGRKGQALSLDGLDDYVQLPDLSAILESDRDWSIAFWALKREGQYRLFSGADGGSGFRQFTISAYGYVKVSSSADDPAEDWRVDFEAAPNDVWVHYAVTWEQGGPIRVYQDGRLLGQDVVGGTDPFFPMSQPVIGAVALQGSVSQFFQGLIDEFRVYDRRLTNDEVSAVFADGGQVERHSVAALVSIVATTLLDPDSHSSASLILEPSSVTGGGVLLWDVKSDVALDTFETFEWEQVSGVPVDILQGTTATLVADVPFVAERETVRMQVRAVDASGNSVRAESTLTIEPRAREVPLSPVVSLPNDLVSQLSALLTFSSLFGESLVVPDDADRPSLVFGKDGGGTVLLSIADRLGGLFREPVGSVAFSIESTATVLVALAAGEPIPSLTRDRVDQIRSTAGFAQLTGAIESLLRTDNHFLERITRYPDLQDLIARVVNALEPLAQPVATSSQLKVNSLSSIQVDTGLGEIKGGFYCTFFGWPCSPWHEDQNWTWFGSAKGADVFLPDGGWDWAGLVLAKEVYLGAKFIDLLTEAATAPPFLAHSISNQGLHALANPVFVNYAMEAYDGNAQRFWRLTPRNSTVLQKLLNSGAAMRAERAAMQGDLSPQIDRIEFNRYRFSLASTEDQMLDHAAWLSLLNLVHLGVSAVNTFHDLSAVSKGISEVKVTQDAISCALDVFSSIDIYDDPAARNLFAQVHGVAGANFASLVETLLTSDSCLEVSLKSGTKKLAELLVEQGAKSAADGLATWLTLGGKALFDAANDSVPVATSFFSPNAAGIVYHLQWDVEDPERPYIKRVTPTLYPGASFAATQLGGTEIRLDASASTHDPSTTLAYDWALVSGLYGSVVQSLGAGKVIEHDFGLPGRYFVRLEVVDGTGLADYQYAAVDVQAGRMPEIVSLGCSIDDDVLQMRLQVSDPDQRAESIAWYADMSNIAADVVTAADMPQVTIPAVRKTGGNWAGITISVAGAESLTESCWTEAADHSQPERDLLLHYAFEGDLSDSASTGGGVASGAPIYQPGRVGQALAFDGVDDFVRLPDLSGVLRPDRDWSIEFWAQRNGGQYRLYSGGDGGSGARQFTISAFGYVKVTSGADRPADDWRVDFESAPDDTWAHYAVTWEQGGPIRVYRDGRLVGKDEAGFADSKYLPNSQPVLGALHLNGVMSQYFEGLIDEFRIYGRKLSGDEILSLAQ